MAAFLQQLNKFSIYNMVKPYPSLREDATERLSALPVVKFFTSLDLDPNPSLLNRQFLLEFSKNGSLKN